MQGKITLNIQSFLSLGCYLLGTNFEQHRRHNVLLVGEPQIFNLHENIIRTEMQNENIFPLFLLRFIPFHIGLLFFKIVMVITHIKKSLEVNKQQQ